MPAFTDILSALVYPEVRPFSKAERQTLLERAKQTPFDFIELVGMAAGLALVTAVTRFPSGIGPSNSLFGAALNFVIAIPLLAIVLGPFLIRRTRRGLRVELDKRRSER